MQLYTDKSAIHGATKTSLHYPTFSDIIGFEVPVHFAE